MYFTIELLHIDDTVDLLLFQNVSCQDKVHNVWFNNKSNLNHRRLTYHMFYYERGNKSMCLTRGCNGKLHLTSVNSPNDRKCYFLYYRKKN